jgi:hypothetical protein
MKARNLLLSPICLLALGSASIVYSPIGCGCVTEADSFLQHFNIARPDLGAPESPNTAAIEAAVTRELFGKKVSLETLPGVTSCVKLGSALYRCTYWLWRAPGRERGVELTLVLNGSGVLQSSRVRPALRVGPPALPGETEDAEA